MMLSLCTLTLLCAAFAVRPVRRAVLMTFLCLCFLPGNRGIASAQQANEGSDDSVSALIGQLHAPEVGARRKAARAIGEMGVAAKSPVPMLAATVRNGTLGEPDEVEAFTGDRGNEGISVENYAMLRVRRTNGKWKVLGTVGGWTVGDA